MKLLRNPIAMATTTIIALVLLYFSLMADRAILLMGADDVAARLLGVALLALPVVGVGWAVQGWLLGTAVQRMSSMLADEGRLPIHDGATLPNGRLTEDAAEAVFEVARRGVEDRPDDWRAWYHVAYAYEASGNSAMARKALRHASGLFRSTSVLR